MLGHAFEQGHPLAQAFLVIADDALHGRFGDGSHFLLLVDSIGNLIHTFDIDKRGIHIEGDQPVIGKPRHFGLLAHQKGCLGIHGKFTNGKKKAFSSF
jgi:hypothetical protein